MLLSHDDLKRDVDVEDKQGFTGKNTLTGSDLAARKTVKRKYF